MERRLFSRFKADLPICFDVNDIQQNTRTKDISEGGICLATDEKLDAGELSIVLNNQRINLANKWSSFNKETGFLYGMEFADLKQEQRCAIKKEIFKNSEFIEGQVNSLINLFKDDLTTQLESKVRQFFLEDIKGLVDQIDEVEHYVIRGILDDDIVTRWLRDVLDTAIVVASKLEDDISSNVIKKEVKKVFRSIISAWFYQSDIIRRAFEQPRGYPGDYQTIELVYGNKTFSKGLGEYLDRYMLDDHYAVAVRNRKNKMVDLLVKEVSNYDKPILRYLNLGCGSCRDIKEFSEILGSQDKKLIFSCVDQDEESLEFAKCLVVGLETNNIKTKFFNENVMKFYKNKHQYLNLFGIQDVVYSIGLADYLPDRILKDLINFSYGLLDKGGKIILAHKERRKDPLTPQKIDWYCNWKFIPRTEWQLIKLIGASGIENCTIRTVREETGRIFFLMIEKNK